MRRTVFEEIRKSARMGGVETMGKIRIGVFGAYRGMTMVKGCFSGSMTGLKAPDDSHFS